MNRKQAQNTIDNDANFHRKLKNGIAWTIKHNKNQWTKEHEHYIGERGFSFIVWQEIHSFIECTTNVYLSEITGPRTANEISRLYAAMYTPNDDEVMEKLFGSEEAEQ